jgi:carboxymethylenebutenolidase
MINERTSLVLLSLSLIITYLVLSMNFANFRAMHPAYAQTNAAMFATLANTSNNNSSSALATNVTTSGAAANNTSSTTASNNTTEGLQIKKGVNYFDSASDYLVYPANSNAMTNNKKLPGVIMSHENRGFRSMANTLAREGYVVLAVDLFRGQVVQANQQAQPLTSFARSNPTLHSQQHPLVATILYYGTPLVTDKQQLSKIKWPVLGIFGDKDQAIPLSNIQQFKAALDSIGIQNEIHIYKGLGHAFANPSGANYAPNETVDAWQKTLTFLKKYT